MTEPYERAFSGRVKSVLLENESGVHSAEVVVIANGRRHSFQVLGSGPGWTPGQRVDVILRAVHEPKAEEVQDAD